jgi:UDP-hydrolysing UDP-N-acetyl-D-glucosamine 2-epimerase
VVLVDRANYGRLKPVMRAIDDHPDLRLIVVAAGTMVLERFGKVVDAVRADGFSIDGELYMEVEGSTPATMAKSVGFGVVEFAGELQRLTPDVVLIIGDRYEAFAASVAAAFMNIPVLHMQGGEVSGSIDESTRHAITKFAQFHYPATERAADIIAAMGERRETILGVGCPSSDIALALESPLDPNAVNARGSGREIDLDEPFVLAVFHPTTTEFGDEDRQMSELLRALDGVAMQTLLLWPNIDAGADHISKVIRVFRTTSGADWLRTVTNLSPEDYLKVLAACSVAVGNSSSFVRDAGFLGTPVVLVGDRQTGREHDVHVRPVAAAAGEIAAAVRAQIEHGRYPPSFLYGDGMVAQRVAESLAKVELYQQKRFDLTGLASSPDA